jgi:hypothetical protein
VTRDAWIGGAELMRTLELFVIGHLGNELGVVDTDKLLDALEPFPFDDKPLVWIDDPAALTGTYVVEETALTTESIVQTLARIASGERT